MAAYGWPPTKHEKPGRGGFSLPVWATKVAPTQGEGSYKGYFHTKTTGSAGGAGLTAKISYRVIPGCGPIALSFGNRGSDSFSAECGSNFGRLVSGPF